MAQSATGLIVCTKYMSYSMLHTRFCNLKPIKTAHPSPRLQAPRQGPKAPPNRGLSLPLLFAIFYLVDREEAIGQLSYGNSLFHRGYRIFNNNLTIKDKTDHSFRLFAHFNHNTSQYPHSFYRLNPIHSFDTHPSTPSLCPKGRSNKAELPQPTLDLCRPIIHAAGFFLVTGVQSNTQSRDITRTIFGIRRDQKLVAAIQIPRSRNSLLGLQ